MRVKWTETKELGRGGEKEGVKDSWSIAEEGLGGSGRGPIIS